MDNIEILPPPGKEAAPEYPSETEIVYSGAAPYADRVHINYNLDGIVRLTFCENWQDTRGSGVEFRTAATINEANFRAVVDVMHEVINKLNVAKGLGEIHWPKAQITPPLVPENIKKVD